MTLKPSISESPQTGTSPHGNKLKASGQTWFWLVVVETSQREKISFSSRKLIKKDTPPITACSFHQLSSTSPPTSSTLCLLHILPSLPAPVISLALTDTARRARLPVVSIFHLDAGDSALPLQFITWITRKGHRVARLSTFPVATAIHGNPGISAGCSQWTWRANTQTHTLTPTPVCCAVVSF